MAIRTKRLGEVVSTSSASSDSTIFTVPAGFVYLVKSAVFTCMAAVATNIRLGVSLAGGGGTVYVVRVQGINTIGSTNFDDIWIALEPGDALVYRDGAGGNQWYISGATLPGT